jgi:prophage regulatory protein
MEKEEQQSFLFLEHAPRASGRSESARSYEVQSRKKVGRAEISIGSVDRIMRRREVEGVCGMSRSTLYRLVAAKNFPAPVKLSKSMVGFLASEVFAWIESRIASRDEAVRLDAGEAP